MVFSRHNDTQHYDIQDNDSQPNNKISRQSAKWRSILLCCVSMLSVANKPIVLSVIMLSVVMLKVVMLSVEAPFSQLSTIYSKIWIAVSIKIFFFKISIQSLSNDLLLYKELNWIGHIFLGHHDTQHNDSQHNGLMGDTQHYGSECYCAECNVFMVLMRVIMFSVAGQNVVMLSTCMLSVVVPFLITDSGIIV